MSIDQAEKDEKEEQKAEMNFRFTLIEELRGIRRALEPKEQLVCKQIMNDGLTCNTRYEKVLDLLEVSKAERNMFAKELKTATDGLQQLTNLNLCLEKQLKVTMTDLEHATTNAERYRMLFETTDSELAKSEARIAELELNQREPG